MKQCPRCKCDLKPKRLAQIDVDECASCQGIWFEQDELRQAKDATDPDLNWMDFEIWKHEDLFTTNRSAQSCPACELPMVTLNYGDTDIEIDYCPACRGTWLDNGEFQKIIASLEEELASKPLGDYTRESLKEAQELITGPESFISEWKDLMTVLRMMEYRLFVEKPKLLSIISSIGKSAPS